MKIFILGQQAALPIISNECEELIEKKPVKKENWCELSNATLQEISQLTYRCQAANRIGILLGTYNSIDELIERCDSNNFSDIKSLISESTSFRVKAIRQNSNTIDTTVDIASRVGGAIHKLLPKHSVNMKTKELPFIVVITPSKVLLGLDLVGFDLAKRPYKIFSHPTSLNGVLAYTVARLAGIQKDSVVLDPFCDSATIPIETALWQQQSSAFLFDREFIGVHNSLTASAFDEIETNLKQKKHSNNRIFAFEPQLRIMLSARKNIKLSGMQDVISCSKVSADWIDAKFEENSVDFIISKPPQLSKRNRAKKTISKTYDELFYQARYILKKNGRVGLVMHNTELIMDAAQKNQFKVVTSHTLMAGEQHIVLYMFEVDTNGM